MLNMDVLVSLGAASAYTLSVYQMLGEGLSISTPRR